MPIVKAKIGPQIMNLICDDGIYDQMPVRGEVKAMVSGIYIISVKNVRGKVVEKPGKKTFGEKLRAKQRKYQNMYDKDMAETKLSKEQKADAKAKAKAEREREKKIQKMSASAIQESPFWHLCVWCLSRMAHLQLSRYCAKTTEISVHWYLCCLI